jgi:hypothetical protein
MRSIAKPIATRRQFSSFLINPIFLHHHHHRLSRSLQSVSVVVVIEIKLPTAVIIMLLWHNKHLSTLLFYAPEEQLNFMYNDRHFESNK